MVTWAEVRTKVQKKRLIRAVIIEIEKLKRSPALKGILKSLILGSRDWAPGGWYYALKIDKNGRLLKCNCGRDYDAHVVQEKKLEELIEWMKIHPQEIKKIKQMIEK